RLLWTILISCSEIYAETHSTTLNSDSPQCHPHTRTAVQGTIQAWADEDSAAPSVMWLYGPAGAGKSAIAQTMAE
ncbi:hypothetical protein B0H13DRAFT_1476554, partial [Mycena leptocephala]